MSIESREHAVPAAGEQPPPTVVKVGGALLTGAAALAGLAAALAARHRRGERLLVVASALAGVTDLVETAAWRALDPRGPGVDEVLERLRRHHLEPAAGPAGAAGGGAGARAEVEVLLAALAGRLAAVGRRGSLDERERAHLLSYGERLSAPLVAAAIAAAGAPARAVDAEAAGLAAVGPHGDGTCDLAASAPGLSVLGGELARRVVVLTGFYGVDAAGDVVLFGRGGSDYTAGAAAAGLGAAAVEFWKDTAGILSADPRLVPAAQPVAELSFAETARLGSLGARVLHPRCLDPLRGRVARVVVRAGPGAAPAAGGRAGTLLVEVRPAGPARVAALTGRPARATLWLDRAALAASPGLAGEVVGRLAELGGRVGAVGGAASRLGVVVAADALAGVRRVLRRLNGHRVAALAVEREEAEIGLVGEGVDADDAVRERVRTHLADLGVRCRGLAGDPAGTALRAAVHRADLERCLVGLHARLFERGSSHS